MWAGHVGQHRQAAPPMLVGGYQTSQAWRFG